MKQNPDCGTQIKRGHFRRHSRPADRTNRQGPARGPRHPAQAGSKLLYKNIELDPGAGQVLQDGVPVSLSPKERCLLAFLLTHRGQAFTREELLACVWGVTPPQRTRTVDMHIRQLRRKLGPELDIATVFKVGYRLT